MTDAIKVKTLTKRYPKFTLDNICFSVKVGHITGLIGRNGAGKSTTIKGILKLISADGEVEIFGKSMNAEERAVKQFIGYVSGGFRHYPLKSLATVAKTFASFYPDFDREKYNRYLAEFNLDESKKIKELSDGMKVKFSLALAVSHGAKLLIMDEPTSGLDPLSREEFCDIVLSLVRNEGVSVLFSTHITSDLMRIADDIVYISDGKVLADEPLNELLSKYALADFTSLEQAKKAEVIGLKQTKDGYQGLIKQGCAPEGAKISEATLDHIMIYLENAKKQENGNA